MISILWLFCFKHVRIFLYRRLLFIYLFISFFFLLETVKKCKLQAFSEIAVQTSRDDCSHDYNMQPLVSAFNKQIKAKMIK